jgi:sugar lactone lactonase YvrE
MGRDMQAGEWDVAGETRDRLGESPLWHPREQALYWIDFYGPTIHRLAPATGAHRQWKLDAAPTIGSLCFAEDGRLLAAMENGIYLFDPADGRLTFVADPNAGRPGIGYNDAKVDRDGRYWVGTYDLAERAPRGILYRLDADGRVAIGDSGHTVCNGPAFSPSGDTLYFSDTVGRRLLAYDLDRRTGALSTPRLLASFGEADGLPDGLCVDSAGAIYCAQYGGGRVTRFGPAGEVLQILPLPVRNVTSCCLGGPSLDILYATTGEESGQPFGGALFAREVDVPGLPEPFYAGALPARAAGTPSSQ